MGSLGTSVVILLGSGLLAAYLFYGLANVHPDIQQPDFVVWLFAKRTYIRGFATVGEYLGLGHRVNNSRSLASTSLFFMGQAPNYDGVKVRDEVFDGVGVRIHEPEHLAPGGPALIWIHGGGWVFNHAKNDDFKMNELCRRLGILIVNIDYRLAPEHPYPIPFEDCYKASLHFIQKADKYGVDPKRVAIGGASAGGNLAAAVALKFRDTKQPISFHRQILFVPCLQMFDFNTPSYQQSRDDAYLPKYWMVYYWLWYGWGPDGHRRGQEFMENTHTSQQAKHSQYAKYVKHDYIPNKYMDSSYIPNQNNYGNATLWEEIKDIVTDPYFAPLMAKDLKGLPGAYIATAHYDVLRDDGLIYGKRLEAAGVAVHQAHYDAAFHAMGGYFETLELSKKVMQDVVDYLRKYL